MDYQSRMFQKLDIPKLEVNLIFESRAAADAVSSWN
jgi:hypothetical protein